MSPPQRPKGSEQLPVLDKNSMAFEAGAVTGTLFKDLGKGDSLSRLEAIVNDAIAHRVVREGANDSPALKAKKAAKKAPR